MGRQGHLRTLEDAEKRIPRYRTPLWRSIVVEEENEVISSSASKKTRSRVGRNYNTAFVHGLGLLPFPSLSFPSFTFPSSVRHPCAFSRTASKARGFLHSSSVNMHRAAFPEFHSRKGMPIMPFCLCRPSVSVVNAHGSRRMLTTSCSNKALEACR